MIKVYAYPTYNDPHGEMKRRHDAIYSPCAYARSTCP